MTESTSEEVAARGLQRQAEALWLAETIDDLAGRFVELLRQEYGVERASVMPFSIQSGRVHYARSKRTRKKEQALARETLNRMRQTLRSKESLPALSAGGPIQREDGLWVLLLGSAARGGFLCAWEGEAPGAELRLLACQAQNECRWFHRLDQTQSLLYEDDLTGLFNYRYLEVAVTGELRRAQRYDSPFSLLFLDIDQFKEVNDRWGHLTGSAVLRQVGEILRESVREVDAVIRYGGDEYVVVLIGTTSASACTVAERIRQAIESYPFRGSQPTTKLQLTASIGVSSYPESGHRREDLLQAADDAMYQSKEQGRNRVTMHVPREPIPPRPAGRGMRREREST